MSGTDDYVKSRSPIEVPPVDPAAFGDPFAQEIDWKPLGAGGASGPTRMHSIVADGPDRLLIRGDSRLQFAGYPIIAIGLVIVGFGVAALSTGFGAFLVRALVGVVVAVVGYVLVDQATTPIVFDRAHDLYQRGNPRAPKLLRTVTGYAVHRLSDVRAIQILQKVESSTSSTSRARFTYYLLYEVNLVLEDRSRVNVLQHGQKASIRSEAAQLAEFVGVPVWDGSG